ncbi:MAG: SpoIIIAH-like family protein [Oscillospiraceae bacterium]|nr:SpoIIIAH-like family protein [Oscillospiraceae bacterium]
MRIWKRNAVVSAIVLFVCLALYLSWAYGRVPGEDELDVFEPGARPSGQSELSTGEPAADTNNPQANNSSPSPESKPYFNQARLSRRNARDDALSILSDAAANEEASQEIRDNASKEISKLAQNAVSEANIENLVVAKGYEECVAFINQDGVKIVVTEPEGGMTDVDANIIADIVINEHSVMAENINVVPVSV